jgi:putative membrane-bound dehydrogenase-like protein
VIVRLSVCLVLSLLAGLSLAQDKADDKPNHLNEPLGDPGAIPVSADGKPLNLNFETGTLEGWKAEGKAFEGQPIKGEIAQQPGRPFGEGKKSEHTGAWWIGGYEKLRDAPTGTLTSAPFEVTHPYCSFLIGGGSLNGTRVELVTEDDDKVFYRHRGKNEENLRPVIVDLSRIKGRKLYIRLVDQETGGWGHVNFDDFRFHAQRPKFKPLSGELPVPEVTALYPHAGLSGDEAAKAMVVPPGFSVQCAAQEPDVQQPIAMAIDDRGRIWIAEAYEYPVRAKGDKGRDRILIFEDTDLDGKLDKRTVFYEGLNLVSGLELGFGGVWVGAAPYLLFIPDKDYDDKPDGEPVKLLDGFGWHDTHETLNSFIWGPDGWLYGCHGVFTHSRVGKPGTPDEKRIPINAGIWRYHPVRHEFEVFAHGTSNPWGLDFNEYGQAFATACVIPHLYHIIPGGRYQRQAGEHFNPYTYDDIKTIAEHRHYTGNQWNDDNRRQSDTLGGGHAHAGCMIYQGGAWPEKYRGQVFMSNIHGNRINMDVLTPKGSGYVGSFAPDFLLTRDQASQMLYLTYGPDGQVWVIDWYDMQQCHRPEVNVHDRSNGRIYRIVYNNAKPVRVDLRSKSDEELVKLLGHKNAWYPRHARRILQERAANRTLDRSAFLEAIRKTVALDGTEYWPVGNYWAAHAAIGCDEWIIEGLKAEAVKPGELVSPAIRDEILLAIMIDQNIPADARAWAVRLHFDTHDDPSQAILSGLAQQATKENSWAVRLSIASALLRIKPERRWEILEALTKHREDAADHNLPLMYWYAMEPLADVDPARALALAMTAGENIPILKEYMIRRIGAGDPDKSLALLMDGLKNAKDDATRLTFLRGMNESLKGRREVKMPAGWQQVSAALAKGENLDIRHQTAVLSVNFGDAKAAESMAGMILDEKAATSFRRSAIQTLAQVQSPALLPVLLKLLASRNATEGVPYSAELRADALRALASFDAPQIPAAILAVYGDLSAAERRDALATLSSRPAYAAELLAAVGSGKIPANHLTADLVTNLRNLNDEALNKRIEQVWGVIRSSPEDVARQIEAYKRLIAATDLSGLTPTARHPDLEVGRAVFAKTCQVCHALFGTGSKIGPDLTGSNRQNLDYLLQNIVDPSAVMAKEYQPLVVRTLDGRTITGIKKEETADSLSLQTQNELIVVSKADIENQKQSDKSMMPDNQLLQFTNHEIRSLVAYLQAGGQTPMQATADNVSTFYNGKDLTGWVGDAKLWSVEDGEIVGKTAGLAKNEFLISELSVGDFRLALDVKLVNDEGNSGIQIRSQPIAGGEMRGYQADIGPGWWGKLYEEHGRALLEAKGGEAFVKKGEWNHYEIVAAGSRVRTWINGNLCVDRDDPFPPLPLGEGRGEGFPLRKGVIGLQLHSGGKTEVRFKNLKLTLGPSHVPALPYPASKNQPDAPARVSFKKTTLDRAFRSEGVGMGDFNNDGFLDISAGSVWYENPGYPVPSTKYSVLGTSTTAVGEIQNPKSKIQNWTMHVLGEKPNSFDIKTYGDTFMNWAEDVDGDGRLDLVVVDFPGKPTWWFQNPGQVGEASSLPWKRHQIVPVTNDESPLFLDIDGDGRRENRAVLSRPGSRRHQQGRPQRPDCAGRLGRGAERCRERHSWRSGSALDLPSRPLRRSPGPDVRLRFRRRRR